MRLFASRPFIMSILLLSGAVLWAQTPTYSASAVPDDLSSLLGMTVGELFARFGAPDSVSAVRGDEAWQDDVVFSYPRGFSVVIYKDRAWQFRCSQGFPGSVLGLFVGDAAEKATSLLGVPTFAIETTLYWQRPGKAFPVRLRVDVLNGRIVDLYLYRADF